MKWWLFSRGGGSECPLPLPPPERNPEDQRRSRCSQADSSQLGAASGVLLDHLGSDESPASGITATFWWNQKICWAAGRFHQIMDYNKAKVLCTYRKLRSIHWRWQSRKVFGWLMVLLLRDWTMHLMSTEWCIMGAICRKSYSQNFAGTCTCESIDVYDWLLLRPIH